eukprot:3084867-Pyramimonas_sp.AAC.1
MGVTEWASPWAKRVGTDVGDATMECPGAEALLSRTSECRWLLFEDEEAVKDSDALGFADSWCRLRALLGLLGRLLG